MVLYDGAESLSRFNPIRQLRPMNCGRWHRVEKSVTTLAIESFVFERPGSCWRGRSQK